MSIAFADEVITSAHVRFFDLPSTTPAQRAARSNVFALITLDNGHDHSRPSTFGPAGLASLAAAIDEIESHSPAVCGVGVTGKPFIFAVGADLGGVGHIGSHTDALAVARAGHQVFARMRNLPVPTFAFINGAAMGGGLELALHCDYRTLSSASTAVSFPEVFLGLVPGWGGTQLLPNLIGPAAAIEVIIANALNSNTQLRPKQAVDLGIADLMLAPADFLVESVRWAESVIGGSTAVHRRDVERGDSWDAAVTAGRLMVDTRLHGAAPAPYRALELIALARTAQFSVGTAAEDEALAALIMSDELRSGLYAFDLVNRRAKRPVGAPNSSQALPVTKVGVIGAGLMATQLALLFLRRLEVPVVLTDLDPDRLARGLASVFAQIDSLLAKARISADTARRLSALVSGSVSVSAFADADFIIEAVFEDLAVKKSVFANLEKVIAPTAVLATNTSSLSVSEMAADLHFPDRVVGLHFFNPVSVLPLVEVVAGKQTNRTTLATAFAVAKSLKKSAILVTDAPGFVVNRLLTRFMGAVISAVDEGTPIEIADEALQTLGFPMTPFALLELVGPAIALHVSETLNGALGERFEVSENLRRLVAAHKSGVYVRTAHSQVIDPDVTELLRQGKHALTGAQVRDRALTALAQEISMMLCEGVVAEVADIDLAMLLGAGWPFHLGGISPYLARAGYGPPRDPALIASQPGSDS